MTSNCASLNALIMTTQNTQTPPPPVKKTFQEETVTKVLEKINAFQANGDLRLPANYSADNALRSAFLILQDTLDRNDKPVLEVCTPNSIINALFEMVMKGLNPVKKQCYFIAYGNELSCDESYFGKEIAAKRVGNVKDIKAATIYEKDIFRFEKDTVTGRNKILEHKQELENIDHEKVKGAYCIITFLDGTTDVEIMSMKQIRAAWAQGAARGNSPAHKNFSDEMAEKTVISRACKAIINSTDDATLYTEEERPDQAVSNVKNLVGNGANKKEIGFDEQPITQAEVTTKEEPAPPSDPAANQGGQIGFGGPGF